MPRLDPTQERKDQTPLGACEFELYDFPSPHGRVTRTVVRYSDERRLLRYEWALRSEYGQSQDSQGRVTVTSEGHYPTERQIR